MLMMMMMMILHSYSLVCDACVLGPGRSSRPSPALLALLALFALLALPLLVKLGRRVFYRALFHPNFFEELLIQIWILLI